MKIKQTKPVPIWTPETDVKSLNYVEIYRNLAKDCFSVKGMRGQSRGRVIDYLKTAYIVNAKFVVQPSGRRRVLEEKRKNVHAFVRGYEAKYEKFPGNMVEVSYNPYRYDHFYRKYDDSAIYESPYVELEFDEDGRARIWALEK